MAFGFRTPTVFESLVRLEANLLSIALQGGMLQKKIQAFATSSQFFLPHLPSQESHRLGNLIIKLFTSIFKKIFY